jgi:hypothetical protein
MNSFDFLAGCDIMISAETNNNTERGAIFFARNLSNLIAQMCLVFCLKSAVFL